MSKRKPLKFNQEQLTQDLQESTGQGVDAFFASSPTATQPKTAKEKKPTLVSSSTRSCRQSGSTEKTDKCRQGADQSVDNQSIDQSTSRPTNRLTSRPSSRQIRQQSGFDVEKLGPIVSRPRAFYITHKVDRWLDEAVSYLKKKDLAQDGSFRANKRPAS